MSLHTFARSRSCQAGLTGLALALTLTLGTPLTACAQRAPTADWWSAIERDDVSDIQGLLLQHTDPNAFNKLGNPALTQAAREQSWEVFDALLTTPGVEIDQPNAHDETALMYLCILGQTGRARALIAAGAQVNRLGWTPLHYAASKAQVDTARMLMEKGAIVNAPGPDGTTPLMMAALSGKPEIVRLLLAQGADPTMFNAAHETAADWARKNNNTALAESLEHLAVRKTQQRQGGAAAPAPRTARQEPAPPPEGSQDAASFSRYFDLDRFEDTPAGR